MIILQIKIVIWKHIKVVYKPFLLKIVTRNYNCLYIIIIIIICIKPYDCFQKTGIGTE